MEKGKTSPAVDAAIQMIEKRIASINQEIPQGVLRNAHLESLSDIRTIVWDARDRLRVREDGGLVAEDIAQLFDSLSNYHFDQMRMSVTGSPMNEARRVVHAEWFTDSSIRQALMAELNSFSTDGVASDSVK